jgi:hypothetical protein
VTLLESSFGSVGFGDDLVISGLLAQDFAVGLPGDDLDVLLVDVLAAQLFAAVLIGGYAGHDSVSAQRFVRSCQRRGSGREEKNRQQ